jgi:hypothetical protein
MGVLASICGCSRGHHVIQIPFRMSEEAEVIQRPAAADVALRQLDAKAGGGQNLLGCLQCLRMKVVVPGIRPKHHARRSVIGGRRLARERPLKTFSSEGRQSALRSNACDLFDEVSQHWRFHRHIG